MTTKTITHTEHFDASPHEVYEALMDSKKHTEFTGSKAHISRDIGGEFDAYDGYITGTNKELIQDSKIVQEWVSSEFPKGHISTVTFLIEPSAKGATLRFTHEGVPPDQEKALKDGWEEFYWTPMKEFFKS